MAVASQYDTKQKVINELIRRLFEADKRRLQQWIDKLDGQNRRIKGDNNLLGFVYLGRYYRPSHVEGPDPTGIKAVDPELHAQLDAFLKDEKLVDEHQAFIRQGLYLLLDPCTDDQELRDALPECLVDLAPELKKFNRQSDEAWTLENNPRAKRQFEKVRPMIDTYAMARLIY